MMDTIFINNYGRPSCPNSYLDGLPSLKTKMPPENGWLEGEFPFGKVYFQGLCWFQGG